MKLKSARTTGCAAGLALAMLVSTGVWAADKSDRTGTNPINFTHDFRVYHEMRDLEIDGGDGDNDVTTIEFRAPIVDGDWQFRTRIRFNSLEVDVNDDGIKEIDDRGVGEVDMRFLTVPYLDMKEKRGLAVGMEIFLPTGNDITGSQTLSLGPQIFGVFFQPFGVKTAIIAPAVQYKFSIDEEDGADDVEQFLFDIFYLQTFGGKQYWLFLNPQFVVDEEQDTNFGFFDVEVGMMLDRFMDDTKGHSVYVRPSLGMGGDKFTDTALELGYKIIW